MRYLTLRFDSAKKLAAYLLEDQEHGGVFCATDEPFELGELVRVTICLPGVPEGVVLAASVVWRRRPTRGRTSLIPGVGLGFGEQCQPQIRFLEELVAGGHAATRRSWPRHPIELPVEVRGPDQAPTPASTGDFGLGGMFVRFDGRCPVGDAIDVDVFPADAGKPVPFSGRIAWARCSGPDAGFGMAFHPGDTRLRRLAELIILANEPLALPAAGDDLRATVRLWGKPRDRRRS
jgi:Tfp pilus assembly protein PilZ